MLKQRLITASILAPMALLGLFGLTGTAFAIFTGSVICIGAWEWSRLSGSKALGQIVFPLVIALILYSAWLQPDLLHQALVIGAIWWLLALVLVASYPASVRLWRCSAQRLLMGLLVLVPAWAGLILLRDLGWFWLLYAFLVAWIADICAYFAGKAFGKNKLAPAVSPGKTVQGVAGGLLGTSLLAIVAGLYLGFSMGQLLVLLLITWLVTGVSVLGDLTESMLKREAGRKDSSRLLPGHGGVMDRIDSLTSLIPVFTLLLLNLGSNWL